MSNEERNITIKNGLSVSTILFFIFLVLKLTKVINWSWWWVTAPLWAGLAVTIIVAFFLIMGIIIGSMFKKRK